MNTRERKPGFVGSAWKLFAGILLIFVFVAHAQTPELIVTDAWTRPPLRPRNIIAVFMTIENRRTTTRSIVSVSTPDARQAQLHEVLKEGSLMRMTPIKTLLVPAHGTVELRPGSFHIMCFGLKRSLKPGDTMSMVLTLDDRKKIPVVVTVRAAEDNSVGSHGSPMPGGRP